MECFNYLIVGDGVFGSFLYKEFKTYHGLNVYKDTEPYDPELIDYVILAVPETSYAEVAEKYKRYHLVNVCSVQEATTEICIAAAGRRNVTSIHPMFGPRSGVAGRTCILTFSTVDSEPVIEAFQEICEFIVTRIDYEGEYDGMVMTPQLHDELMAKTQLQVVKISDQILQIVQAAKDIPNSCLPTSFKQLEAFAEQFLDMPEGTKSSILSNKRG